MRLRALDQFHISSVSPGTLKVGSIFAVSDSLGEELMKKHPGKFKLAEKSEPAPSNKSEPAPSNKSEPAPSNKSATGSDKTGDAPVVDYKALTIAMLKDLATERGIDLGDATKKDDIIAAIELHDEQSALN